MYHAGIAMPSNRKPFQVDVAGEHIIAPNGTLVPISYIEEVSRLRMQLYGIGPPDWRNDPSYFWADECRRKKASR